MATSGPEQGGTLLRVLIVIVAIVLLVPLLLMLFTLPMMGMMGIMGGRGAGAGTMMSPIWGIGVMLLFIAVLLGIGYAMYRTFTRGSLGSNDAALEELRMAYARGELSQEEFEQRRDELERTK